MKATEAIKYMNALGHDQVPFLFIIDYEQEKPLVYPLSRVPAGLLYNINGHRNVDTRDMSPPDQIDLNPRMIPFETYLGKFSKVLKEINYGNSFLLNLTCRTEIFPSAGLGDIFQASKAPYKLFLPGHFVVFSPETFIKINDGVIASFPMKGTIDARIPGAKEKILGDLKETAEHNTIVDLIRNDLSMVAKKVELTRFRYIEEIRSRGAAILQVSSEIRGRLPDDYRSQLGHIIFTLLPAGSISGAPKPKTLEIIRKAEGYPRGYYTGVAGIFDGKSLDSFVMIRFIEQTGERFFYRSGGGITSMSNARSEFEEIKQKIYVPIV